MYVRNKTIIIGLALLISSQAFSMGSANVGKRKTDYARAKAQFQSNQSDANYKALRDRLQDVSNAIDNSGMSQTWKTNQQKTWLTPEQNWFNSIMPQAPTRAQAEAQEKEGKAILQELFKEAAAANPTAVTGETEAKRGNTRETIQRRILSEYISQANQLYFNRDIIGLTQLNDDAQKNIPGLDLITPQDRNAALARILELKQQLENELGGAKEKAAAEAPAYGDIATRINNAISAFDAAYKTGNVAQIKNAYNNVRQLIPAAGIPGSVAQDYKRVRKTYTDNVSSKEDAIKRLFAYIATKGDDTARKAESTLIRILANALLNADTRNLQNTLILLITNPNAQGNAGLVAAYDALKEMAIYADRLRATPITEDDKTIKVI